MSLKSMLWAVPVALFVAGGAQAQNCKAAPGSADWPAQADWDALNEATEGRLIKVSPLGAVCHPDQAEFDEAACQVLADSWNTTIPHSNDPFSVMWPQYSNNSCMPDKTMPCVTDGFASFAVNATTAEHVKAAVDFARQHNIRLTVKNTGHDYLGRSSGAGSLAIWTHHMKSMSLEEDAFQAQGCTSCAKKIPRAVMGPGCQFGEIYPWLDQFKYTLVGGASFTVGLGGYLSGGGHGLLSADHGLAIDQVLEVEMVTPQGEILVLNECQNQELYWAVRGGGGSTYGVITRFTVKVHPSPRVVSATFSFATKPNTTAALGVGAYVLSKIPDLVDAGMRGYFWSQMEGFDFSNPEDMGGIFGSLSVTNTNDTKIFERALAPIAAEAKRRFGADKVKFTIRTQAYPTFLSYMEQGSDRDPVGFNKYVDSWLLSADALRSESPEMYEANKCMATRGYAQSLRVLLVSGKGVHEADSEGTTSVNPFWRKNYAVIAMEQSFKPFDEASRLAAVETMARCMGPLRALEPTAGGYLNEATRHQPNWQFAFWGDSYPRLLDIKKKTDPDNVFWCEACVGSEGWEEIDGQLCQV